MEDMGNYGYTLFRTIPQYHIYIAQHPYFAQHII